MSNARILADLMGTSTTVPSSKLPTGTALQTVSTNFNDIISIGSSDSTGVATGLTGGFSFMPDESYVNITAKKANSKYLVQFDGNASASNDTTYGDWIGGWGFVVDPAGGTSWTQIGSGTNRLVTSIILNFILRGQTPVVKEMTATTQYSCVEIIYIHPPHRQEQLFALL